MKLTFWLSLQMSNMKPLSERTVWAPLHCGHFLSGVFLCDLTDCAKSLNTLSNLHANQEPQAVAPCYSCPLQKFDWAAFHLTDMSFVQSHSKFLFCFFGFVFVPPHSFRHTFISPLSQMDARDRRTRQMCHQTEKKKHILDIKDISFISFYLLFLAFSCPRCRVRNLNVSPWTGSSPTQILCVTMSSVGEFFFSVFIVFVFQTKLLSF